MLWLWLSWVRPDSRNISWADCEETMCCGTKARRLCLAQLVQEGFVTVQEDGVVIMHDPYAVFRATHKDFIPKIKKEFAFQEVAGNSDAAQPLNLEETSFKPVEPAVVQEKPASTSQKDKAALDKERRAERVQLIIGTWNENKPSSYSKMRTLSAKQFEAVGKHLKNLDLKYADLVLLIKSVCIGLTRSDFWSNKIDTTGRNFSAVFGYGNPHDTKLKNIENLYMLGQDDSESIEEVTEMTDEQKDLIKSYKYISFQYEKAKNRNNHSEMQKWHSDLDCIHEQLQQQNISIEAL